MIDHKSEALIPEQNTGKQSDNRSELRARDPEMAVQFYHTAADRLMDVNRWREWSGSVSASFQLTTVNGDLIDRKAQEHDLIRIDIPGPGNKAGDGYDWVRIEKIVYDRTPAQDLEFVSIQVRPTANPLTAADDTAHFFSEEATSTFLVRRAGKLITAEIHGRNEKANTEAENALNNVRNKLVAETAAVVLSDWQWKSLADGLLKEA